jgi:hypothetical protein
MRNRDEAMRELDARKGGQLKQCVISVLRIHEPASQTQGIAPSLEQCTAAGAQYPYVLVMEREDGSLDKSLSTERIAGFAYEAIRNIIRRMLKLVLMFHSKGLAHNNLKVKWSWIPPFRNTFSRTKIVSSSMVLILSIWRLSEPNARAQRLATSDLHYLLFTLPVFVHQLSSGKYATFY